MKHEQTVHARVFTEGSSERGSTFVEFALVANLIFLIFSAVVDFSLVVTRYNILSQALFTAGRKIQVETQNCSSIAHDAFMEAVNSYGMSVSVTKFETSVASAEGLVTLDVEATVPCMLCTFFYEEADFKKAISVALANSKTCPSSGG